MNSLAHRGREFMASSQASIGVLGMNEKGRQHQGGKGRPNRMATRREDDPASAGARKAETDAVL
jgi:hypothetical protein